MEQIEYHVEVDNEKSATPRFLLMLSAASLNVDDEAAALVKIRQMFEKKRIFSVKKVVTTELATS